MKKNLLFRTALFTTLLGIVVVLLGGYVRLSDAGLGCPDWPGCYGRMVVPDTNTEVARANAAFPERPLEIDKAWKEMVHRYAAGLLGLSILLMTVLAWRAPADNRRQRGVASFLLALVVFQALLGMWTVTHLVKPAIVTSHLFAGFATVALAWWIALREPGIQALSGVSEPRLRLPLLVSLVVIIGQIFLGAWTSTNYAALGCTAFPGCFPGNAWPEMDFAEAFVIWRSLGVDYEFGVLDADARAAIHMAHRIGALVTLVVFSWLIAFIYRKARYAVTRKITWLLAAALAVQIALGITNVLAGLPIASATAHNGVALLLILILVTLLRVSARYKENEDV